MLDHDKAMKLWNSIYGKSTTRAHDRKGREIRKESYGDRYSEFGWDVHHKRPKKDGGTDNPDNLEIVHHKTHDEIHGR
jgi:hypothetical protein